MNPRAVVDNQVWVRAFLRPDGPCGVIAEAAHEGRFTPVTSEPLLAEIADVLARASVARKHQRPSAVQAAFVGGLRAISESVATTGTVSVCRDPKDDVVIETACLGSAIVLVSGDLDLHAPEVVDYLQHRGVRVLAVHQFLSELSSSEHEDAPADGS